MIEVNNLVFEYPGTRALDDVSFSVEAGEITALVGPNGAGKTTLLKCLSALDKPIAGSVSVDGIDVLANPRECHRRVGYLADFFGLYVDLTVKQCLLYAARVHDLPAEDEDNAVSLAASRLQIENRLDNKVGTLSRGLSQRLAIAQSIIHEPKVLMLDEPASGLDPEARSELSGLFRELSKQGITLLVSSHILAELEEYCTSMLVVREGKVLEHRKVVTGDNQWLRLNLELTRPVDDLEKTLSALENIKDIKIDGGSAVFGFNGNKSDQSALLQKLINQGLDICAFGEQKASLQEAYLEHVSAQDGSKKPS